MDEKGNDEETGCDGETFVNANLDNNGTQQQQVSVNKDLINGEIKHDNTFTVTDDSSKLVESVNQTTSPQLSSPVSTQQPSNLNDTTFANSTQVASKPQPIYSSQKLDDTDTDMQPLLEIAHQTPDPPSSVDHLATKEEQKEANLSKFLIVYICLHTYVCDFCKILNENVAKFSNEVPTTNETERERKARLT